MNKITKENNRIQSIDFVRGFVMIIMALDHVRDFFHTTSLTADPLNLNTTTPSLFLTRWITHFCAPTFVFLSGISAYLSGKNKTGNQAGSFMIKRGLWLVIADAVIMTFALSFNPHYNFVFLTVLWAIGCSMILLGIFIRFFRAAILPVGLLLFFGHNLFGWLALPQDSAGTDLLNILFRGNVVLPLSKTHMAGFLYSIIPWAGVMFTGYGFGKFINDKKKILYTGLFCILLFFVLRFINDYGDPAPWQPQKNQLYTVLSFLNTTKYPPSLQFLCMTLGPVLILLATIRIKNSSLQNFVMTYGKVPFFYFVMHFFIAHILLAIAFYLTGHTNTQVSDPASPFYFKPPGFGFSLPVVYAVWITVVLLMYYPNKWFYSYKKTHKYWWLRYL